MGSERGKRESVEERETGKDTEDTMISSNESITVCTSHLIVWLGRIQATHVTVVRIEIPILRILMHTYERT